MAKYESFNDWREREKKSEPTRKRGRPKAIRLGASFAAYPDMSRREREHFRRDVTERLNDTDAAAAGNYWCAKILSLALEPYGIQLVPVRPDLYLREIGGPGVFHVYQDWPQQVRRKVSGSVWDGRKLIWRKPIVRDYPHKPGKLSNGPKIRCAHRSWKSAEQLVAIAREKAIKPHTIGEAATYPKPHTADDRAAEALLTVIGHLATPETKRARTYLDKGINDAIVKLRAPLYEPVTFWTPYRPAEDPIASWRRLGAPIPGWLIGARMNLQGEWRFQKLNLWPLEELEAWRGEDVFQREELGAGEAWWASIAGTLFRDDPYADDPAADRKPVNTLLYRSGTTALQCPDVGQDEPFRAAARLWNWQVNNRHREQMRTKWPKLARHGECTRVDHPRAFPDDPGGQCCRWTCGGFKSCPLQCWERQKRFLAR